MCTTTTTTGGDDAKLRSPKTRRLPAGTVRVSHHTHATGTDNHSQRLGSKDGKSSLDHLARTATASAPRRGVRSSSARSSTANHKEFNHRAWYDDIRDQQVFRRDHAEPQHLIVDAADIDRRSRDADRTGNQFSGAEPDHHDTRPAIAARATVTDTTTTAAGVGRPVAAIAAVRTRSANRLAIGSATRAWLLRIVPVFGAAAPAGRIAHRHTGDGRHTP